MLIKNQVDHVSRFVLDYADGSVMVSLLQGVEQDHGRVHDELVNWCDQSFLQINVAKTKDMFIDLLRHFPLPRV